MPTAQIISLFLGVLGVGGAALGAVLASRGKKDETKLAERKQTFDAVVELGEQRLAEINRLQPLLTAAYNEIDRLRAQHSADVERIRNSWEERWSRQMKRCRDITDALTRTIIGLKPPHHHEADQALADLAHHNEDDHSG